MPNAKDFLWSVLDITLAVWNKLLWFGQICLRSCWDPVLNFCSKFSWFFCLPVLTTTIATVLKLDQGRVRISFHRHSPRSALLLFIRVLSSVWMEEGFIWDDEVRYRLFRCVIIIDPLWSCHLRKSQELIRVISWVSFTVEWFTHRVS